MKGIFRGIVQSIIGLEARLVLRKYKPKIVAVAGSVGKTSTKDAVFEVLSTKYFVRKSEKSYNGEIGIPLTILGCPNAWTSPLLWLKNIFEGLLLLVERAKYPEWLVLEVGVDRPGDMKKMASWLHPDIIVYTRLPAIPVHVEYFASPDDLIEEKLSLIAGLKDGGMLVLNDDDEKIQPLKHKFTAVNITTYGMSKETDVYASHYQVSYKNHKPIGVRFHAHSGENEETVEAYGVAGKQHMYPALAALAVGIQHGVPLKDGAEALARIAPAPGRMRILDGIKDTVLIDDTYNSSPVAVEEALNLMELAKSQGKKIIVLGDMLELGQFSIDEHKRIGEMAGKIADLLVTVGPRARHFAEGALIAGLSEKNILQYDDSRRAGKELESKMEEGDMVLLKGSQGVRMERTVREIMAHPEKRHELIVRQDPEWEKR